MSEIRSQATPDDGSLETEHYQLFNLIENTISAVIESAGPEDEYWEAASAVLKAGWSKPRTVDSWDDIRPTIVETVIRDAHGDVFELWEDDDEQYWMTIGNDYGHQEPELPITVLFTPGDAG